MLVIRDIGPVCAKQASSLADKLQRVLELEAQVAGLTERMGEVMAAYAELPVRLLSARSPVDFWAEYFRFGTRLLSALQPSGAGVRAPKSSGVARR